MVHRQADEKREQVAEMIDSTGEPSFWCRRAMVMPAKQKPLRAPRALPSRPESSRLSAKNRTHAAEHSDDGEPIGAGGAFAQQPRPEQRDPYGRGVLEEDGVGGGGELGGGAERDRAGRIADGAEHLRAGKVEPQASADGDEEDGGDQAAPAGDGEG